MVEGLEFRVQKQTTHINKYAIDFSKQYNKYIGSE